MVVYDLALHIDAKDALTLQKDLLQLSTDADFSFRDWVIVGTGSHKFWIKRIPFFANINEIFSH
jgi:hypothetical protein